MLTRSFSIGQVHKIMSKNYIFIDHLKLQKRMVVKDIKILIRDSRCALGFIIGFLKKRASFYDMTFSRPFNKAIK